MLNKLLKSIKHWNDILEKLEKGSWDFDYRCTSCACCDYSDTPKCTSCPIYVMTKQWYCDKTPWRDFATAVKREYLSKAIAQCHLEIMFLENCYYALGGK